MYNVVPELDVNKTDGQSIKTRWRGVIPDAVPQASDQLELGQCSNIFLASSQELCLVELT